MIGAVIGICFGVIQFILLFTAVRSITSDRVRILPMLAQFFCPMAGLLLCAFVKREQLLTCAICIISILLLGAVANAVLYARRAAGKKGSCRPSRHRKH